MFRSRVSKFLLVAAVTAVCAIYGARLYAIRQASFNKTAVVRALPKILPDPHFRLAQILDYDSQDHVRVIAIEKHHANTAHHSLQPSFCELDIDNRNNTALMYIEGHAISPSSDLVVFMAEYGAPPHRVIVDRSAFDEIYPLHDDRDLWELCVETINLKKQSESVAEKAPAG